MAYRLFTKNFLARAGTQKKSGDGFDDLESTISNAWLFILVTNDQLTIRKSSSKSMLTQLFHPIFSRPLSSTQFSQSLVVNWSYTVPLQVV